MESEFAAKGSENLRVNHIKRMRKDVMSSGRGNAGGKEKESAEVEEQRRHRGGGGRKKG